MIERFTDWEHRLDRYLADAERRPFAWGAHDCVLFSLGAALAIAGVDAGAELRGAYDTALGAARVMRRIFGAADLEAACESFRQQWDGEEVPVLHAQRGDIVLADVLIPGDASGERRPALGVLGLDGAARFVGMAGLERLALRQCRRAWRVG